MYRTGFLENLEVRLQYLYNYANDLGVCSYIGCRLLPSTVWAVTRKEHFAVTIESEPHCQV